MAIVKKNISNAAIDGLKLLLLNNQPVKARNSLGTAVELFKLDDEDSLRFSKIPKVTQAPSESSDLANKQYVDGLIASVPSVHLKIVELSSQDISNQYIDLDIQANPDSLIIAAESRVMLFNGIDFSHSVVGGLSRLSFAGSIAAGEPEALEENEKLYVWSYPASGFSVSGGGGGNSVLNGAGAPSLALGSVGDFYINTSDFSIYGPKAVTGWGSPVSLVGPAGAQGEQGEIGPVGPQGEVGPQGPQGEVGPVGPQGEVGPEGPQGPQGETGTFDYTLLGQPNGVAPLNAEGKIDAQFYSSIAITDVFVVADIAERDALTVQSGDVAKVLDSGDGQATTFIYSGSAWVEMETSSEVLSVNSKTGSVVLNTADIAESGATNRYFTPAREAVIEAAIEAEEEARALADNSLEARLDALEGSGEGSVISAKTQAIQYASDGDSSEAQLRQAADEALDQRLDVLEGDATVPGSVAKAQADAQAYAISIFETEEQARESADESLDARLDIIEGDATVEGSIVKAQADAEAYADTVVSSEATARQSADEALDLRLDTAETEIDDLQSRVTTLESAPSGGGGTATIDFEVFGDYSIGGSSQTGIIVDRVAAAVTISDARLLVNRAGTTGTLQVDVQQSTDGVFWSSIFSFKPSILASAGNYAVSSNQVLVASPVPLAAGTLLRLNIDSIQTGNPSGFSLKLIP